VTKASIASLAGQGLIAVAKDNYPRDGMTHSYVASFAEIEVDVEARSWPLRKACGSREEMIEAALRESGGRVSGPVGAAARLGTPGSTLDSKINISKNHFKTA
jgi:hypothetical protein